MEMQTIGLDDIERILLQEPHVTRFIKEDWKNPGIDFSLWFRRERDSAIKYTGRLGSYLVSPYIEDDFNDHQARREWRKQMAKKHSWFHDFYSRNPFRNNRINITTESAKVLRFGYIGTNIADLLIIIEQIKGFMTDDSYHQLPLEEKREHVYGLKGNVHRLLIFLGEQTPLVVGKSAYKVA